VLRRHLLRFHAMGRYWMRVASLYIVLALVGKTWSWVVPTVAQAAGLGPLDASGSGDTSWHYLHVAVDLTLACAGAAVWSVWFRSDRVVSPLLRFAVRAYLFKGMTIYGLMKIGGTQFPAPTLVKLATTFGESSPMGVLWAFMGTSQAYCVFTGALELLGAVLMVFRRTTTLGAVLVLGVMGNVVMLNLCYDVPVKLHAIHYLAGAVFLVAADGRRLVDLFLLDRPVPAAAVEPIFETPRLERLGHYVKVIAAAAFILSSVSTVATMRARFFDVEPPPLYGIWQVERFESDHAEVDPWTQLVVAERGRASLRVASGNRYAYRSKSESGRLQLIARDGSGDGAIELDYVRPGDDQLTITGDGFRVELRRVDDSALSLRNPQFRWISDKPNHRWK